MSRTQKAFERRFRDLFAELGARDRDKGLSWVHRQADKMLRSGTPSLTHAYTTLAIQMLNRTRTCRKKKSPDYTLPAACHAAPRVHCDAGLGGLARWLRAAGCEAFWHHDISDADLVRETQELGGFLLTTDSQLLDRRPIVRGEIYALWIPPTLTMLEQLRYVRAELDLSHSAFESRCMRCGGELIEVDKAQVRDRIPPRTYNWLSEFFECVHCHQLFWDGTHWQRISRAVQEAAPG